MYVFTNKILLQCCQRQFNSNIIFFVLGAGGGGGSGVNSHLCRLIKIFKSDFKVRNINFTEVKM